MSSEFQLAVPRSMLRVDSAASSTDGGVGSLEGTVKQSSDSKELTRGPLRWNLQSLSWVFTHLALVLSVVFVGVVALGTAFPSLITRYDPDSTNPAQTLRPPSAAHIFGTDRLGRDLFARVVYGGGATIGASLIALSIAVIAGLAIGVLAGYRGGAVDAALMRFIDVWLAIPGLLLAITIVTAIGFGTIPVAIAIGIGITPAFVRATRSQVLKTRSEAFIEAAKAGGASTVRIILTHVLPNSVAPVAAMALLDFGAVIMGVATLSFLGFGAKPPAPEWGSLINDGRDYLVTAPWVSLLPGLVVVLMVLSVTVLGGYVKRRSQR